MLSQKREMISTLFQFLLEKDFKVLNNVSYWNGLYIFAALGICILYSSLLLIVPQHDIIQHSQYWYEPMFIFISVFPIYNVLNTLQDCYISFGIDSLLTFHTVFNLFLATSLGFCIPYSASCVIWAILLGYNPPVPFAIVLCYPMMIIFSVVLWFQFPCNMRADKIYRKRLQIYLSSFLWTIYIHFQYAGLSTLFTALSVELHWILAIIMPISRYFNLQVYKKFVNKYAGPDNKMAHIRMEISIGIEYSIFVAVMLASATEVTLLLILGGEFLLNTHKCYRILRLRRKIRTNFVVKTKIKEEIHDKIRDLVMSELIEVLVPLAYFSTFVMAYFGPNAAILGGIQNDYWDYEKVENLGRIIKVGMEMFLMDLSSSLICGGILYKFCKINVLQEFCKIIKQCWTVITLLLSGNLITVSCNIRLFY